MGFSRKLICVLAVGMASSFSTSSPLGFGQTTLAPVTPAFSAPTSAKQVIDHLNLVLRWYRQWEGADVYLNRAGDLEYIQNGRALAQQVLQLEFQSALTQAALIGRATAAPVRATIASQNMVDVENIFQTQQQVGPQIDNLKTQLDALNRKIPVAKAKDRSSLLAQREMLQGQLELAAALQGNLEKLTSFMTSAEKANGQATELSGKILALQRTVPGAQIGVVVTAPGVNAKRQTSTKPAAPSPVASDSNNEGLVGQLGQMFSLTGSLRSLDELGDRGAELATATQQLRAPLLTALRSTLEQGQVVINTPQQPASAVGKLSALRSAPAATTATTPPTPVAPASAAPTAASSPVSVAQNPVAMAALIQHFKLLSNATLPLSQELILIAQCEANQAQLQSSIEHEYTAILRSVLLRVAAILLSMGMIWLFSELWRRATFRYIRDARRRRQFLVLRRAITGFCMFVIILLGFVSEFSSLATYAGLITAGIAVALQGIILSIAAYFFLIGRYGVRVGDRVTVVYSGASNVSGEVLDIGLVRFYLMELAGTGIDMQPTGRIVVFPNSVLFQTTPLFKQLPGTEYIWRELAFPLHPECDVQAAEKVMLSAVNAIYDKFGPILAQQHLAIEQSMGVHMEVPRPYTRVRFVSSGLEALVRYPIPLREAAELDNRMVVEATEILRKNPAIRLVTGAMPELRSAIKT